MLIVKVKDSENIDKALKRFKRKFNSTQMIKQIREGEEFTKKSIKLRTQKKKAIYIQKLKDQEEKDL